MKLRRAWVNVYRPLTRLFDCMRHAILQAGRVTGNCVFCFGKTLRYSLGTHYTIVKTVVKNETSTILTNVLLSEIYSTLLPLELPPVPRKLWRTLLTGKAVRGQWKPEGPYVSAGNRRA